MSDILKTLLDGGIISIEELELAKNMDNRKKYLDMHNHKIWQGKDGNYYTYIDSEDGRKLTKKNSKENLEECLFNHYKSLVEEPKFYDVFHEWVESKLRYGEIQKQTYDRYIVDYSRFYGNHHINKMYMKDITPLFLEDFIKSTIHDYSLSAKGYSNLRTILIGTIKHAYHIGKTQIHIGTFMSDLELSARIFRKVRMIDEEQVFTNEEVQKIINYIKSTPPQIERLGIVLAILTGIRARELSALQFSDLKPNGILRVSKTQIRYTNDDGVIVREVRDNTKGRDGIRDVILTQDAQFIIDRIRELNKDGDYMFVKNGKIINAEIFTQHLKRVCRYVNIRPRSMHKLRKTYATTLFNAGVDEKIIEKQMGHTNITTTKNYYYYNNRNVEQIKDVLEKAIDY